MAKILRFEMQVADPEQAIEFYSKTFKWAFTKLPGPQDYWIIKTGESGENGIDGGLLKSPNGASKTFNSIEVNSVDDYLKAVIANGGTVPVPKVTMPGMGYLAYCIDPSGILFGIAQPDPTAK